MGKRFTESDLNDTENADVDVNADIDADEDEDEDADTSGRSEENISIFQLEEGIRLDIGLAENMARSRSFVRHLLDEEKVKVNGLSKKANYKIRPGDRVEVEIPAPREANAEPENIPLTVLYEDEDILVVNKPQGMVVHPAPGAWRGTLVNALLYHCRSLSGINGVLLPGIVHRIDKDTSGILVAAKNDDAHRKLAAQLAAHSMKRKYLALVHGLVPEATGTVEAPIGRDPSNRKRMAVAVQNGKPAVTHYSVLERFQKQKITLLEAELETGRTHQIRVHMQYLKHPVLGDSVYGPKENIFGLRVQMLHAAFLGFTHPRSSMWLEFSAPVPQTFADILESLSMR